MKQVEIYTDGACSGNPGPGGWAAILVYGDRRKELSGFEPMTTNNRMELTAAVAGLRALKEPCAVVLYSDSAYLVNAFQQGWIEKWQRNGWRTADKKPVENQDLWQELLALCRIHKVEWRKLRGHAGHELNERCDALARAAIAAGLAGKPPAGAETEADREKGGTGR
ncbi:MAG: ribonuclease HI [Firmicutes bacterium]|nr:ribonuclease HI [Bacillota bacterium]